MITKMLYGNEGTQSCQPCADAPLTGIGGFPDFLTAGNGRFGQDGEECAALLVSQQQALRAVAATISAMAQPQRHEIRTVFQRTLPHTEERAILLERLDDAWECLDWLAGLLGKEAARQVITASTGLDEELP